MNKHSQTLVRAALVTAFFSGVLQAHGAEPDEAAVTAIRTASQAYVTALQAGDVKAVIDAWTPQGTFVDASGAVHLAREMAAREFSAKQAAAEARELQAHETAIRLTTPDVAIEQSAPGGDDAASFMAIWVKQGGRWRLDYLREIGGASTATANPLEDLEWLIGKWQAGGDGPAATLEAKWIDDKRFIVQKFRVERPDGETFRMEQRIGWDPASEQIRSWLFRSDGGFEEGIWSREGDVWVVKKAGVLPDGQTTSTVNFWTHEPPETCWFKACHSQVGEQKLEDVVMQLKRVTAP